MKIIGLLNWFDESASWLSTAVAGISRICDTIIACDGAYALYPGARARSHPRQAEAIMHAAEAGGAGCLIYRPISVWWGNEIAKRNQLIRLAGSLELTDEDWLLVFDADIHVLQADPELARARLAATDLPIATYTVLDGKDFLSDERLAEYVNTHDCDTEWTMKSRDIFRWNPTLRVGPQHWLYSVRGDNGREWVRGPSWDAETPACDLGRDLVCYHRPLDRPKIRRAAQEDYYKMREAHRAEYLEGYDPPTDDQLANGFTSWGGFGPGEPGTGTVKEEAAA